MFAPDFSSINNAHTARCLLEASTLRLLRPIEPPRATLRLINVDLLNSLLKRSPDEIARLAQENCHYNQVDKSGSKVVTKDFFDCSDYYRQSLGRWLIAREFRAYQDLQGIKGIPEHVERPRPDILSMDYIAGRDLKAVAPGELPHFAVEQLDHIISEMHKRRVVHFDIGHDSNGDYGRETNLLWTGEQLYLIDFAGAVRFLPPGLFGFLAAYDRLAITKLKSKFFPEEKPAPQDQPSAVAIWLFKKLRKF